MPAHARYFDLAQQNVLTNKAWLNKVLANRCSPDEWFSLRGGVGGHGHAGRGQAWAGLADMATPDGARRGRGWRLVGGRQVPFLKSSWGEVRLLAEAAEARGFARRGRAAGCSDGGPGERKGTTQTPERRFYLAQGAAAGD